MAIIRKGTSDDIAAIVEIYDSILDRQDSGNITVGWIRGVYPTEKTACEALNADELFVMEDNGRVAATARINRIQVPEYADAKWEYDAPPEQVMVLHILVVDPSATGRGLESEFVAFYEKYALEHGCPYLRIDTNAKNANARRLYAKLGYNEADIVPCVFNGIPDVQLVCLEKSLVNIKIVQ